MHETCEEIGLLGPGTKIVFTGIEIDSMAMVQAVMYESRTHLLERNKGM